MEFSLVGEALSAIGNLLTVFSILMVLVGIFFGNWVNSQLKKVERLNKETKLIKDETSELIIESRPLIEAANGKFEDIFSKLSGYELDRVVNHLENVPQDLNNFWHYLGTEFYSLDLDHYKKIIKVLKISELTKELRKGYLTILFLHFPFELYGNHSLWEEFENLCKGHSLLGTGLGLFAQEFEGIFNKVISKTNDLQYLNNFIALRYYEYVRRLKTPHNLVDEMFLKLNISKSLCAEIIESLQFASKKVNCCDEHKQLSKKYFKGLEGFYKKRYRI